MVLGGLVWGTMVIVIEPSYTLLGAAVFFLFTLSLAARLSIDFKGGVSNVLCMEREF